MVSGLSLALSLRVPLSPQGRRIVQDVAGGVVVSGLSLVLRSLRPAHSGAYACAAANAEGQTTSSAVHLAVRRE